LGSLEFGLPADAFGIVLLGEGGLGIFDEQVVLGIRMQPTD
jgi:hypothetical protein